MATKLGGDAEPRQRPPDQRGPSGELDWHVTDNDFAKHVAEMGWSS